MKYEDAALLDSLATKIAGALVIVQNSLRDVGVAQEILRRRMAEHRDRSGVVLPDLIDDSRFTVCWKGAECPLGPTVVYRLFCRLARRTNHYVSVAHLSDNVWKKEHTKDTTVRSTVRHLRRKLHEAGMGELAGAIRRQRGGHYGLMLRSLAQ